MDYLGKEVLPNTPLDLGEIGFFVEKNPKQNMESICKSKEGFNNYICFPL